MLVSEVERQAIAPSRSRKPLRFLLAQKKNKKIGTSTWLVSRGTQSHCSRGVTGRLREPPVRHSTVFGPAGETVSALNYFTNEASGASLRRHLLVYLESF